MIADTLAGAGTVTALGGDGYINYDGGLGRIRLERVTNANTLQVVPDDSPLTLPAGATAVLWPPDDAPTVKIVSIGGKDSPADPRASFGTYGADVVLPEVAKTPVVIETTNVEEASQVEVRVTPKFNASYTTVQATNHTVVTATPLVIRWTAELPVNVGYSAVQVKVVRP